MPDADTMAPPADPGAAAARTTWRDLGEQGLLRPLYEGPGVDDRFGYDVPAVHRLLTGLDRRSGIGSTLGVCVQVASAIPLLRATAGSGPGADVLHDVLDGTARLALAATDTGSAGSDLTGLTTAVTLGENTIEVTGTKCWIVNAETAGHALVLARHAEGRAPTAFTLVLVPLDATGVTRIPADTTAFPGAGIGTLDLDRVRLGRGHVLGRVGRGLGLFLRQMNGERLASGMWAEALSRRVLASTGARLGRVRESGARLADNPAARQRYAEAVVEHQGLAATVARIGAGADDAPVAVRSAAVKAAGARTLDRVLDACAPLWGAEGFLSGGLQELRGPVSMFGIAGGATPTLLELVADHSAALLGSDDREETT